MAANEYLISMDRYCGFVYFTLIEQMIGRLPGEQPQVAPVKPTQNRRSLLHDTTGIDR